MWERSRRSAEFRSLCELRRLWLGCCVACLGIAFVCPSVGAQEALQTVAADAAPQKSAPQNSLPAEAEREVSWRGLPRNFFSDQKDIWLFPGRLAQGRHWGPPISVTGRTGALIAADARDTPHFRRTARFA